MVETNTVLGMVLSSMPIGEYDRRLVLLTREFGKITAFVRGARKPTGKFLGGSQVMSFGEFTVYRGRSAYTITDIKISEYFSAQLKEINKMYLGMYFLELSDYYGREGIEASQTLKLLYFAFKALNNDHIPDRLVRLIVEFKTLVINGEYPDLFHCQNCGGKTQPFFFDSQYRAVLCRNCCLQNRISIDTSTLYALQYIVVTVPEKLFGFTVSDYVFRQMKQFVDCHMKQCIEKKFNSLQFLENND